jgi:hypothetical protein
VDRIVNGASEFLPNTKRRSEAAGFVFFGVPPASRAVFSSLRRLACDTFGGRGHKWLFAI